MTNRSIDKPSRNRFVKSEILRGYRAFGRVLSRGRYVQRGNIRCYYDIQREIPPYGCTVGFAVKKPRSAVQRNRVRRLLRESYRQRKHGLLAQCAEQHIALRCVFLFNTLAQNGPLQFVQVDRDVEQLLNGVQERLQAT